MAYKQKHQADFGKSGQNRLYKVLEAKADTHSKKIEKNRLTSKKLRWVSR
jgi:hypothetical protein